MNTKLKSTTLFKYRKFDDSCIRLLSNRELWFASPSSLNDPFDGQSSFSEVLDAVWARHSLPQEQQQALHSHLQNLLSQAGICSFSRARKNQLMWSHYADEHKGICIGFKEHLLRPNGSSIYPLDITYQSNYPFEDIIKRIDYFEKYENVRINTLEQILDDILDSILGTKYTSWKYERERRLVYSRSQAIKFEPKAINSISFGLKMSESDKQRLRNLLSGSEWKHVKWLQASRSKTKYALDFEPV